MLRRRTLATVVVALLAATALAPATAHGDADPASDVLLYQQVFYPYRPVVDDALKAQLDGLTARTRKEGFPLKVAIVASQNDLGAVSSFFEDPRGYASFLEHEIRTNRPQPLLVVMPAGLGTASVGAQGAAAVARIPAPTYEETDGLTRVAIDAVRRIAAANGHPLPAPPPLERHRGGARSARHHGGGTPLALVFAPVALLALAALGLSARRRRGDGEQR